MRFPTDRDMMSRCWNQNTRLTTLVDGSSTSQMCCVQLAAHKKQVPSTVVMWLFYNAAHCFWFVEMILNLTAPHARYHQTQHSRCAKEREGGVLHAFYRQTTVLWQRTKKDPCTIHKAGCKEKKGRHWRLFKYESEDCSDSDGIGSSFYKLFHFLFSSAPSHSCFSSIAKKKPWKDRTAAGRQVYIKTKPIVHNQDSEHMFNSYT